MVDFSAQSNCIYSTTKNNHLIKVISNNSLFNGIEKDSLNQLLSIADLPNIADPILGFPDMHVGYGVPIGSAFGSPTSNGIISSEAVGFDINCGIRLIKTNLYKKDVSKEQLFILLKNLQKLPLGLSQDGISLSKSQFDDILLTGVNWCVSNNFCNSRDKKYIEKNGFLKDAKFDFISSLAIKRGITEVGTLGIGNHFIDILEIQEVIDPIVAREFGLSQNQICIMLHTGSRGFGHQIATEFNDAFFYKKPISYQEFNSELGQKYYFSMLAAGNYAFVNRAVLSFKIIDIIKKTLNIGHKDIEFELLYDLCHNIASIEKHNKQDLVVHRKGAAHAVCANDLPAGSVFSKTGTPIILPGSMLWPSYVLVPTKNIEKETMSTVAHGSGRAMSRTSAKQNMSIDSLRKWMAKENVLLSGKSINTMREEQPNAYKFSEDVVNSMVCAGIVKPVVKLKPLIVLTG